MPETYKCITTWLETGGGGSKQGQPFCAFGSVVQTCQWTTVNCLRSTGLHCKVLLALLRVGKKKHIPHNTQLCQSMAKKTLVYTQQ